MHDTPHPVARMVFARALRRGPKAAGELALRNRSALRSRVAPELHGFADSYDPRRDGGALVLGPTGKGKSSAAVLVLARIAPDEGRAMLEDTSSPPSLRMLWVNALDLGQAVLSHALGAGRPPLLVEAIEAGVLVLDDLGWEAKRAEADNAIHEVVATRYDLARPTVVTTGQKLAEFQANYSEAFLRKVLQSGGEVGHLIDLWPAGER